MARCMVSEEEKQLLKQNIDFLRNYNQWRRNNSDVPMTMPSPFLIGLNIDVAIKHLEGILE